MSKHTSALILTTLLLACHPADAMAGGYCRAGWFRRACAPACPAPAQAYAPAPPVPATAQATGPGDYAAALSLINAERARWGRGPLAWSAGLAAYAAGNAGVHQPGTNGGAGQCWAGVFDPVQAARMWLASPPHWSILVNAAAECGISRCPSGVTANAR